MKQTTYFLAALTFPFFSFAQQVSYNDVAVIVNDNSQISIDIGNYFAQQRNIPSQNIIHIATTTQEEIDTAQLFDLLSQVSSYLIANDLADSINYIVTTKGVPLKVTNGNCTYVAGCASVEMEMALMLSPYATQIGKTGSVPNPYFNGNIHFKHSLDSIYLVTRLDGYSYGDVVALIDRSGANTPVIKNDALFVFDVSHSSNPYATALFVSQFEEAADTLISYGWNYVLDQDTTVLMNQTNVLGVNAVDFNSSGQPLNYTWMKGSIAELLNCNTAFTFDSSQNNTQRTLVADAIREGCTGANGYVYCIYSSASLRYHLLLSRYLNSADHFNLAESYYQATWNLSSTYEIVGDPKTSIVLDTLNGIPLIGNTDIAMYPNPSTGIFFVSFPYSQNCDVSVCDVLGTILWKGQWDAASNFHSVNLQSRSAGIYFLKMSLNTSSEKQKIEERVLKLVKQ